MKNTSLITQLMTAALQIANYLHDEKGDYEGMIESGEDASNHIWLGVKSLTRVAKAFTNQCSYYLCVHSDDPHADTRVFGVELNERVEHDRAERIVLTVNGNYYYIRDAYAADGKPVQHYGYDFADSLAELFDDACGDGAVNDDDGQFKPIGFDGDLRLFAFFRKAAEKRNRLLGWPTLRKSKGNVRSHDIFEGEEEPPAE